MEKIGCRICGEEEGSLREPCQCDGSMRYVHEECLLRWLETKGRDECEVCKTPFEFEEIYASDAPEKPTIKDVAMSVAEIVEKDVVKRAVKMYMWGVVFVNISAWLCLCMVQFVETGQINLLYTLYGNSIIFYSHVLFPHVISTPLGVLVCAQGLVFVHYWTSYVVPEPVQRGPREEQVEEHAEVGLISRVLAGLYVNVVASLIGVVLPIYVGRVGRVTLGYADVPVFTSGLDDFLMWGVGVAPVAFYLCFPYMRLVLLNAAPLLFTASAFWHLLVAGRTGLLEYQGLHFAVTTVFTILIVVIPARLVLATLGVDRPGRVGYILSGEFSFIANIHDCLLLTTVGVSVVCFALYPSIRALHWLAVLPFTTTSESTRNTMQILFLHVLFPLVLRAPGPSLDGRALREALGRGRSPVTLVPVFYTLLFLVYTAFVSLPVTVGRKLVSAEDDALAFVAGVAILYVLSHVKTIYEVARTKMLDLLSLALLSVYILGVLPVVLGHGFLAVTNQTTESAAVNAAWMTGLLVGKTALIFAFLWISEDDERIFLAFIEQPLDRHVHGRVVRATAVLIRNYALHVLMPTVVEYLTGLPDFVKIFTPVSVLGSLTYSKLLPGAIGTWTRFTKHVFDRRYLLKTQLVNYHKHSKSTISCYLLCSFLYTLFNT